MTRTRTISWGDPQAAAAAAATLPGLDALHAIIAGKISAPPIAELVGFTITAAAPGLVTMELPIGEYHYNPIGSVHGGIAATLLDSVMGCAIHTMLPQGRAYSTLELKISYIRAVTLATGAVTATGRVINVGRKAAFAEATLTDSSGKLYATGSTTCAVWDA
jgi:uncharacterized protein (TIGR00369 family)